ncbi:WecB/TagA/CpsF family glycosyltransferase [Fictibacillus iocasae]|uniref:WecB/TagA/CpsF family glycosyltransferase n=1 Tax=Fictibacillus iocasae TaxID=2715437 RepID=A0ABW2NQ17_9BACL
MISPFGYILNSKISANNFKSTITTIKNWVNAKEKNKYICVCNTHSLVSASKDKYFSSALEKADICTPDGMPLVWALKMYGFKEQDRVDGPNLMLKLCEESAMNNFKIYLYGGTEETLKRLEFKLKSLYMGIQIVGTYSPPFRQLSEEENELIRNNINQSNADLVFVSLGCPKQEMWMYENSSQINSILIGVGAAFNFIIGEIKRPPLILQKLCLEWLFRLLYEPKRLWKRYLYNNTLYILKFISTYSRNKKKNMNNLSH